MSKELREKYMDEKGKSYRKLQSEGVYNTDEYVEWLESKLKEAEDKNKELIKLKFSLKGCEALNKKLSNKLREANDEIECLKETIDYLEDNLLDDE